jgi:hypothetical protein
MPKIKLVIPDDSGSSLKISAIAHIPHKNVVAATVACGEIEITGKHVGLKHVGGNRYVLTFE